MRTNIDIDDELMNAAMAAGPFRTKREAVEAGLKLLQRQAAARKLLELEGKVDWGWGEEEALAAEPNWQQNAAPAPSKRSGTTPARSVKSPSKVSSRKVTA